METVFVYIAHPVFPLIPVIRKGRCKRPVPSSTRKKIAGPKRLGD